MIDPKEKKMAGAFLLLASLTFYTLTDYGGIRSSDSEVVFRVAESLALRGEFSIEQDLEHWRSFGVAHGRGKMYSIFGPLESILLAPLVRVAVWINETEWYEPVKHLLPRSMFSGEGFTEFIFGFPPADPAPHAIRLIASAFNVVVSALGVYVFFLILLKLTGSLPSSSLVALLYALGTLIWPYSGTFFSEPLATLFVLLSFHGLVSASERYDPGHAWQSYKRVFLSGIYLGLATTAHITAILFAPFFAIYFCWQDVGGRETILQRLERGSVFTLGVFVLVYLLGIYNYARFGHFLETGRTVSSIAELQFGYGTFISPLRGLFGLSVGAAKGVLFYVPAAVFGGILWRHFRNSSPKLFWIVTAALAFRVLFIASRSDWHGGFCVGPRYLVMAVPFFLIPIAHWLKGAELEGKWKKFALAAGAAFAFSAQQLYFSLGELFSYLQILKFAERARGIDVFRDDLLYLDWGYSPLVFLSRSKVAPFLLRHLGLTVTELWMIGSGVLFLLFFVWWISLRKSPRPQDEPVPQTETV